MTSFNFRSADEAALALAPFGFDAALQARFAARAKEPAVQNAVKGTLLPLPTSSIAALPALGTAEREALRQEGLARVKAARAIHRHIVCRGMLTP
jgi:hypothetical protein